MRRLPLLVSAIALAATSLSALPLGSAVAADKAYRVSISVGPTLVDVTSQSASARRTKISGRVTGGPVKGRTIKVLAINTTDGDRLHRTYTLSLSSEGRFSRTFEPPVGGVWRLRGVMEGTGSTAGDTGSALLDAFHWTYLYEMYDRSGSLNVPAGTAGVQLATGLDNTWWRVDGKRFGESEFLIEGGHSVVVDIRGHQCKKINFKIGVEDDSPARTGSYRITQTSQTNGTRVIKSGTMRRGQAAYDALGSKRVRDRLLPTRPLRIRILRPDSEKNVHFVLGNAKVFCTYPSIND